MDAESTLEIARGWPGGKDKDTEFPFGAMESRGTRPW